MITLAMLLLLQTPQADIVVTGRSAVEAHAACLRGGCTPLGDARASIAYAEEQFRAGAYRKARDTLAAAVSRNRSHAATDPKPVAALYEAYATVARHDGDMKIYKRAVRGQIQTLRNLPSTDPARAYGDNAMAEMWLALGFFRQADAVLKSIAQRATDEGRDRDALLATAQRIRLAGARGDLTDAKRMLAALEQSPSAADPTMAAVFRVVRLRLAAQKADDSQIDRLVTELGREASARPILVFAPPYEPTAAAAEEENRLRYGNPNALASGSDTVRWADVGFWIQPDGRTAEEEVLRGSPLRGWLPPILKQVAARRYAASPGRDPIYRIERVTLRSEFMPVVRSLIRQRNGAARIEVLDLTMPSAAASVPAPPAA